MEDNAEVKLCKESQ